MSELKEMMEQENSLRSKIHDAIYALRYSGGTNPAFAIQQALQSWFGLLRDYGEMPVWFLKAKWEHRVEDTEHAHVANHLKVLGEEGWQLVCAHPILANEGLKSLTRLYFKRPYRD